MRVQAGSGFAKGLKRFAEARNGAARGSRRVVQFVRQTGGNLAQRGHLFLLILQLGKVANAVRKQAHQARAQYRHARKHLREAIGGEAGAARRRHGADGCRKMGHTRIGQHAPNKRAAENAGDRLGTSGFRAQAHLAVEEDQHAVGGAALADVDLARREVDAGHLRGQPVEVVRRQIGEDGDGAEFFGEGHFCATEERVQGVCPTNCFQFSMRESDYDRLETRKPCDSASRN